MFEIGAVFERDGTRLSEPHRIAGISVGARLPEQWSVRSEDADFFDLKADVMALLEVSNASEEIEIVTESRACLHPGRSATLMRDGRAIGWFGELHPRLVRELDLSSAPRLFELDLAAATRQLLPRAIPVSRFPQVRRDLSLTLPETTPLSALKARVSVLAGSLLREMRVFDVYQGKGIESGLKSIAFGLILQDNNRTLTDDEADGLVARIATALRQDLDARLRE